jgi:signal transduction histidine kinase
MTLVQPEPAASTPTPPVADVLARSHGDEPTRFTSDAIGAAAAEAARHEHRPYAPEGLFQRALPFLFALVVSYALLPVHVGLIDWDWLLGGSALLVATLALAAVIGRLPIHPSATIAVPFAYLAATAMLRDGTGGTLSGYGALMYLAPLWVALYDSRAKVLLVTGAMVAIQVAQGIDEGSADSSAVVRRVLLVALVVGLMALAVHRGVSDLRHAREQLLLEAEARARVNEQLENANASLRSSNRELEQFAYVSSHDIQEPLRMIRSFSQLFVQRHGGSLNEEGHELLGYVVDGAERAQRLVNDLLQYSRVGRSERPFERVELDEVLGRALATLEPAISESGAHVERDGTLPAVRGDASQLESLFVNLVGNALKYHHPDRPPRIRIVGRSTGSSVQVRVEDNGIGFDDEYAEKIFLMFQRLHGRGVYEGTGIGLALCERIVERHGGTIRASGVPGEGATFSFTMEATR